MAKTLLEHIRSLELFVEKSDKLNGSTFVARTIDNSGVNFRWNAGETAVSARRGADSESIDAFVLTFRFFLQDNERTSLRNMVDVFESNLVSIQEREAFHNARDSLNVYLDGDTMFDINGKVTRRRLLDVFIYGGLAHANKDKKQIYDDWMSSSIIEPFVTNEFVVVLFEFLNIVVFIRNLCREILDRHKNPSSRM